MKHLVVWCLLSLALLGCVSEMQPPVFPITNSDDALVGYGFSVENFGVTVDHLWSTHGELRLDGKALQVLQRDQTQDVLLFFVDVDSPKATWGQAVVGQVLVWNGQTGVVKAVEQSRLIEGRAYQDLIVVAGVTNKGQSGSPVFDVKNKLIGLIIGGDDSSVYVRPLSRQYLLDAVKADPTISSEF